MPPDLETPLPPTALDVFVARQPIFDVANRRVAYELLYRDGLLSTSAGTRPADVMCNETALHAVLSIGLDRLTSGAPAWINITREHLLAGLHRVFDPQHIVLELLESISGDQAVVDACARARADGYVLALDDFDGRPELDALLAQASIVKLDVLNRSEEELAPIVKRLLKLGMTVLAERVETTEQRDLCERLGCTLFQGYVFSRPETFAGRAMSVHQLAIVNIVGLLANENVSEAALENAFQSHPTLSYALLRIVNSSAIGVRSVTSIPHAIRIVGRGALSRWLYVMLAASVASHSPMAHEAVEQALARARFCELVTQTVGNGEPPARFMVGLLSRLDVLLGLQMEQVLKQLPVNSDVNDALLRNTGKHASTLSLAVAYEGADWDKVASHSGEFPAKTSRLSEAYAAATAWANERLLDATGAH